jgi:hypothetical protein
MCILTSCAAGGQQRSYIISQSRVNDEVIEESENFQKPVNE